MVDSVTNWATRSMIQSQTQTAGTPAAANNAARQANRSTGSSLIDQLTQTIDQGTSLMKQSLSSSGISKTITADSNLPRGSLIDIVV